MRLGCAGMQLGVDLHKTLLFLCSGGHNWDAKVQGPGQTGTAAQNGAAAAGSAEATAATSERGATNGQASTSGRDQGEGQPNPAAQEAQPAKQMSEEVHMTSRPSAAWYPCAAWRRLCRPSVAAVLTLFLCQDWVLVSKRGREIWEALDAKGAANSEVRARSPLGLRLKPLLISHMP